METQITDNTDRKRFEFNEDDQTAYVEYISTSKGVIYLTHTEVPKKIEGRGIAFKMIGQILENISARELKLVPLCPIVATYIRRNPTWKNLLLENIYV